MFILGGCISGCVSRRMLPRRVPTVLWGLPLGKEDHHRQPALLMGHWSPAGLPGSTPRGRGTWTFRKIPQVTLWRVGWGIIPAPTPKLSPSTALTGLLLHSEIDSDVCIYPTLTFYSPGLLVNKSIHSTSWSHGFKSWLCNLAS